jgi:glycosyltransferase involved in cell wall biosynthesis
MAENLATIVICTRNRAPFLKRCLDGLFLANRDTRFPVLVIDNGSSDSTVRLLEEKAKGGALDFERVAQPGLSIARNAALVRTATPFIVYLDDDAVPDIRWTRAIHDGIQTYQPHIFGGPYVPYYLEPKAPWFLDEFGSAHLGLEEGPVGGKECFSGGNMGWSTQLLTDLGGFDPNLGMIGDRLLLGEETALQLSIADQTDIRRIFLPRMTMTHYVPPSKMRLSYIAKRSFTYGRQLDQISPNDPMLARSRITGFVRRTRGGLPLVLRTLFRNRRDTPYWKTFAARYLSLHMIEAGILWKRSFGE